MNDENPERPNRKMVEPVQSESLLELLDRLAPIDVDFPEFDDTPPEPIDL